MDNLEILIRALEEEASYIKENGINLKDIVPNSYYVYDPEFKIGKDTFIVLDEDVVDDNMYNIATNLIESIIEHIEDNFNVNINSFLDYDYLADYIKDNKLDEYSVIDYIEKIFPNFKLFIHYNDCLIFKSVGND